VVVVAFERDVGGKVEAFREDLDLVAGRNEDVVAVSRVELDVLTGARRISDGRRVRRRRQPRDCNNQSEDETEFHRELLSTAWMLEGSHQWVPSTSRVRMRAGVLWGVGPRDLQRLGEATAVSSVVTTLTGVTLSRRSEL